MIVILIVGVESNWSRSEAKARTGDGTIEEISVSLVSLSPLREEGASI